MRMLVSVTVAHGGHWVYYIRFTGAKFKRQGRTCLELHGPIFNFHGSRVEDSATPAVMCESMSNRSVPNAVVTVFPSPDVQGPRHIYVHESYGTGVAGAKGEPQVPRRSGDMCSLSINASTRMTVAPPSDRSEAEHY
ncbi:hypothetical protein BDW22DRAFT_381065 [Trametopsis cervina]|nr:hypothetical protein BDW22DRAFT_381065 [Trametopsis cervina]